MSESLSILVVDDSSADLMLAREVFSEYHAWVSIETCEGGAQALAHLRDPGRALPDMVILDLNMPGVSGFDVLREMKEDPLLRPIPVVVLSTSASPADIQRAYALYANAYMVKTENFTAFLAQVEDLLHFWRHSKMNRRAASSGESTA
ncbi:response regulator [Deinococcus koreensis]|uniref:Response regulator n=1 Tax=Deinococcus koreensis TaxID=2054903 RepID=A0A2K3UV67_9DEIO|nr:response regulator [Deinococcus koreensis]PNY80435.1 response regulator [Deinococcus koreensis]